MHDNEDVPPKIQEKHDKIFKVMLAINAFFSTVFVVFHYIDDSNHTDFTGDVVAVSEGFYDVLLLISFTFYTIGVVKISKFVRSASSANQDALDL